MKRLLLVLCLVVTLVAVGSYYHKENFSILEETEEKSVDAVKEKEEYAVIPKANKVPLSPLRLIKPEGKQIRKLTLDLNRTIVITGPIGENAMAAANKIAELSSNSNTPIYLVLTSPGGSVLTGASLISAIQTSNAPVYTVCYAFCASMAAMIHQYGTRRYVTDRTILMFHPASSRVSGKVDEIHSYIRAIYKFVTKIEMDIAKRIGWDIKSYKSYVSNELWLDSDEAKAYNVADQIVFLRLELGYFSFKSNMSTKDFIRTNDKELVWIYDGAF